MVRLLFKNSNPKLRSTFWGSPFIPVHGTSQTECCFSRFLLASRLTLHKFAPFLESNHIWMWKFCVNLVNRLPIWFWHPNRIFLSSYSGWLVWQLCCHSIIFKRHLVHNAVRSPWTNDNLIPSFINYSKCSNGETKKPTNGTNLIYSLLLHAGFLDATYHTINYSIIKPLLLSDIRI